MPMLMLICPETGEEVATGVAADDPSSIEATDNAVQCSACGKDHVWSLVAGEVVVHD